jgi:hypothetical protein
MQFGREPSFTPSGVATNSGATGWVCSASPDHFTPTIADP